MYLSVFNRGGQRLARGSDSACQNMTKSLRYLNLPLKYHNWFGSRHDFRISKNIYFALKKIISVKNQTKTNCQ